MERLHFLNLLGIRLKNMQGIFGGLLVLNNQPLTVLRYGNQRLITPMPVPSIGILEARYPLVLELVGDV